MSCICPHVNSTRLFKNSFLYGEQIYRLFFIGTYRCACTYILLGYFSVSLEMRISHINTQITQNQTQNQAKRYEMICNDNESEMLLILIKSERYGMIRHKSLRPSLSAKRVQQKLDSFFAYASRVLTVLSVASLCESVPSGRARIPLSWGI